MTGSEFPGEPPGGWVQDRLNKFESVYGYPHPNESAILHDVNEWRSIILTKEHHQADYDTFKGTNYPARICNLLRHDNAAVKAFLKEHPSQEADYDPDQELDVIVIRFCKSGKDRTGAGVASASRMMAEYDATALTTVSEPSLTEDRRFNAQGFAMTMQPTIQMWNGAMGYKTDGERELLGEVIHEARKYSQESPDDPSSKKVKKKAAKKSKP